jgi:putative toxin-antitoxin system antitoxin component (TIGR02293 family)
LTIATIGAKITTSVVMDSGDLQMQLSNVARILGEKKAGGDKSVNRLSLMKLGEKGLTKDAVLRLAKHLGLSMRQMAEMLPVTERTLQRYGRNHRFSRAVSEQVLQIAEVAARGEEVFGVRERFLSWMNSPSPALGNRTPASLLGSRFGTEMVLDELGRMEHGVVS